MNGTGIWVFNRELGVSESMEQTLNLSLQDENTATKFPITIKWNRLSEEEFAAHQKKVEEDKAAMLVRVEKMKQEQAEKAAKAALLPPNPMNEFQKKNAMRQLNNSIWHAVKSQLFYLTVAGPSRLAKADMDLATKVGLLRAHDHKDVKAQAEKLWAKWEKSFDEYASDEQKAAVAAALDPTAAKPAEKEMAAENPLQEVVTDDGKGKRVWADSTGRFKIEAEFMKLEGSLVLLKKADGKTIRIPKTRLCEADQKLIDTLVKEPVTK